jgi:NADH:ubiquinone oxidoreductase subunit 5 (subunit L)/multisubunit Na+/H+ antiporter MnhA subunit
VTEALLAIDGLSKRKGGARQWIDHGHHALFKTTAFLAAGGYDESFSHNEDAEFDARLAALDVTLDAAHVEALNLVSKPALNFPAGFLAFAPSFMQAGTTVNGEPSEVPPLMPKSDAERY